MRKGGRVFNNNNNSYTETVEFIRSLKIATELERTQDTSHSEPTNFTLLRVNTMGLSLNSHGYDLKEMGSDGQHWSPVVKDKLEEKKEEKSPEELNNERNKGEGKEEKKWKKDFEVRNLPPGFKNF